MEYFEKFERVNGMYLPLVGQGETKATQICTAVNTDLQNMTTRRNIFDERRKDS